jgi:miniconductance mechanosensitive channel
MQLLEIVNPHHWARQWLAKQNLSEDLISQLTIVLDVAALVVIALVTDFIARKVVFVVIKRIVAKSKTKWDDYFYEQKVFRNLVHLIPAFIILFSLDFVFDDIPSLIPPLAKTIKLYIILLIVIVINKALKAFENLMVNDEKLANSPLRTLSQVSRILVIFGAAVIVISILSGIKIGSIVGILAGTSAILILIFQDTINGLLANLQITMYDLLRVGDWVTLSKYGADGDVIAIDLTTVKIRNFDKTISSVPAKAFVNDSFVNWRGMKEAQGRRIMRNINIDISSIRFCSEEDIARFSEVKVLSSYVLDKQDEINRYNQEKHLDAPEKLNGRIQTNIGVYRNYILGYLNNHPNIDPNFTVMVRQLQSTAQGVPIEVYCFANTTVWTKYELIQADIFDHLYAATEHFGLHLYQSPSGRDMQSLVKS